MSELIISRHCVAADPVTGLSPLQQALLEDPHPIRIADVPTGSGKSYAFQYAMAKRGHRVLFIVPTRRLAQNLAVGLIGSLIGEGWPEDMAEAKVAVWSSDETARLKEQGVLHISGHRLRQVRELDFTREGGEMIIAIPEVVSHLLLRKRLEPGQAEIGIFDLLANFDHIVFDEFHTIEPRGFGLAAVCAKLTSGFSWSRAQVSFLSATPLEIRPVLDRLGVPTEKIKVLHEEVGSQGRPLHGDVRLAFSNTESLAALVEAHKEVLTNELKAGRQAVIIYDKLGDLKRELPRLAQIFAPVGIKPARVLVINSIDDSGGNGRTTAGFASGRWQNPDRFDVLIATASVEMGVTFRAANLMFMEPGFEPLNFLQRYGRAARRGQDGQVWVRCDEAMQGNKPWLRQLVDWAAQHHGVRGEGPGMDPSLRSEERVSIEVLTKVLSRSRQDEFKSPLDTEGRYFGTLPNRAAFTAGLYWNALMAHPSNRGHRFDHLREHQPQTAKLVYAWLQEVRKMERDRLFGMAAKDWCDRFEALAYVLRDIGPRLRIVEGDDRVIDAERLWLHRETNILERFPMQIGRDGKEEIRLPASLDDYLLEERNRVIPMVTVRFPHTRQTAQLRNDAELVENWCRNLKERSGPESLAWEDYRGSMEAAEKLVCATGLVISDDETLSMAASCGVL